MDEIHAVLELFVSCRGSSWPLVRIEAEQQLLTQHLLMAAPMDRDEVEDLIGKCFEADRNGEINFLSFWAGMEKLLEHLGLRDPSTYVDDKVYGLQRFRDGLLEEAVSKHQGPTSSVLLTRDEVLHIISQTSKAVSTRLGREDGDASSSSLFWDEVYKETALLESSSVLSITELSMMVFGFLKSYVQEVAAGVHSSRRESLVYEKGETPLEAEQAVRRTTSGGSSLISESDYAPEVAPQAGSESRVSRGQLEDSYRSQKGRETAEELRKELELLKSNSVTRSPEQWDVSGDQTYTPDQPRQGAERRSSLPSSLAASGLRQHESVSADFATSHADAAAFMKAIAADADDPSAQLRQLLLSAGKLTDDGPLSRKDMQHLRYLNAAAIDCLDRMSAEREKRNEEMSDAILSLTRMRTEKQHLIDRLAGLEHQHSQLQLQHEQEGYEKERLDQLQATLSSERLERDRAQRLLREKDEELQRVTQEKEKLLEKLAAQSEDCTRRLAVAHQEHVGITEDYRMEIELLTREKELLEKNLKSAEEAAKTAEAARQQLQGEAHLSASSLRQRVVELEEDKVRLEAEAEENDALILQLQGRLEEKVQQVTILEVKNKQQLRLLQQLRGVRNSLMQLLQEPQEKDTGDSVPANSSREAVHQTQELAKLRAGLKAAQVQIKDLENFIDEMRKEQRRAAHPRYEFSTDSPGPSSHRQQVMQHANVSLKALPTLGAELEMISSSFHSGTARESCASCISKASEVAADEPHAEHGDTPVEQATEEAKPEAGGPQQQNDSAATDSSQREEESKVSEAAFKAVREDNLGGAQQSTDVIGLSRPESNDAWLRRESNRKEKAEAPRSFASLRSEASTIEAASKDPTFSASLPETEDIFDPLELLNLEELPEPGKPSKPVEVIVSRGTASGFIGKSGSAPVINSLIAGPVSSDASGAVLSPKVPTSHVPSPSGLEMSLESKRRLTRRTSGSSNVEQQTASFASSSMLSLPDSEMKHTRHSSRERHTLSDSFGSAASDGSFLMLSIAGDAINSPTESSSKNSRERHLQHEVSKPWDKTTLSGMFSMLGACAATAGNPRDQAVRSEIPSRRARNYEEQPGHEGKSSPKSKRKSPPKLPAAVVAAMSSRDSSNFRSLRRVTQERGQHSEQAERKTAEVSSFLSKAQGGGAAGHVDMAALRSLESSQSSLAEPRPSPKRDGTDSETVLPRARRTVSLGLTESHIKNEPSLSPAPRLPAVQSVPAPAKAPTSSGGNPALSAPTSHSQMDELTAPQGAVWAKGQAYTGSFFSDSESATASHRKKGEGFSGKTASEEACRSGGDLNTKRSPRSRSSSAESPFRKEGSLRRAAPGRRVEEASKPSEGGEAQGAGDRRQAPSTCKLSHSAEGEGDRETKKHRQAENSCEVAAFKEPRGDERSLEVGAVERRSRDKADLGTFPASSARLREEEHARATQQVQQVLGEGRRKINQDEETASAAALLAAAAGVVDASLHQQQQMIQRQQEHHEGLQRAQQRRIDMLQEQLEVLQKSKEQQRESDEQQQKQVIETLQAKLEELQRRQEQREQDFEEAQRKLFQQELEVQLKQRLEELSCPSGRPGFELQTGFSALRCHNLTAGPRVRQLSDEANSRTHSGPARTPDYRPNEDALHPAALSTEDWRRDLNEHPPCAAGPGKAASESHVQASQLLESKQRYGLRSDDARCLYGREQPNGAAGRGDLRNSSTSAQCDLPGRAPCEPVHLQGESDEASSCASSSIMGSQCGFAGPGVPVEEVPTTSSSSFVSQVVTPGVCSSLPSHRAGHFSSEGKLERQPYARGGDPLVQQTTAVVHNFNSVAGRHLIQHSQPSDSLPASHSHVPAQSEREDLLRPAWVVQRINSCTGSLWSPKASKRQAAGLWGRDAFKTSAARTPTHRDLLRNFSTGNTHATGPQEALHQKESLYDSGSLRHPPNPGRQPRQKETRGGGLPASACHPVSRAERIVPVPLAPVDSARFLGNSAGEKEFSGSEVSRTRQSRHAIREPQLDAPPFSARSSASTSHWIASGHRTPLNPLAGSSQHLRNNDGRLPASADFLGMTSVRSTMSQKVSGSRTSQALGTKQSGLSRRSDTQMPFSPGRPRSHAGSTVSTRSLAATTGRDSLIQGPRRTVSSFMSKLPHWNASEFSSPNQRDVSDLGLVDRDVSPHDPRDVLNGKAAVAHKQARTKETLPDVVSRSAPHSRYKVRRGSSRTERFEGKSQPKDGEKPGETAVADSSKSVQLSVDWAGFNTNFMSQVQKWIS